ncbi:hypothetical protein FHW94_003487 [Novosphingobium sp. SG720]|nr:hypothetical protein [Novosphingobium sp. SG720]
MRTMGLLRKRGGAIAVLMGWVKKAADHALVIALLLIT